MRKLEQNDYYKALDRFMAESGITDDKKKSYCQYFTEGGCLATSQKTCKGCRMFCPTTPKKVEIVVGHALKMERLNDSLSAKNDELMRINHELEIQVSNLNKEINTIKERTKKLRTRVGILKYLKPDEIATFLSMSLMRRKQVPQKKETGRPLNKKLMKEWDEVRLLLNPNARR